MRDNIRKIIDWVKGLFTKPKREIVDIKTLISILEEKELYKNLKSITLSPLKEGVAIYARVANNENNGLSKQVVMLEEEAELVGDMNCIIYSEVASGISKDEIERKELYRLISDAEAGFVKRVYIKCRDRFAKDFVFAREIAERLNNCGVEIIEVL